jgi:hypothetical protein
MAYKVEAHLLIEAVNGDEAMKIATDIADDLAQRPVPGDRPGRAILALSGRVEEIGSVMVHHPAATEGGYWSFPGRGYLDRAMQQLDITAQALEAQFEQIPEQNPPVGQFALIDELYQRAWEIRVEEEPWSG